MFEGFSGVFGFGHGLIYREIWIWRRSAVELGKGVIAANTKTTLTKKKLGSYIDNLVNFGLKVPEYLKNVV